MDPLRSLRKQGQAGGLDFLSRRRIAGGANA